MSYQLTGSLLEVFDTQQVSETFTRREFVVEVPGQYPEQIKLQLVQTKCDIIDAYRLGDQVTVDFDLRGRGYNKDGRMMYFTNLNAWKIQPTAAAETPTPTPRPGPAGPPPKVEDDSDGLPF